MKFQNPCLKQSSGIYKCNMVRSQFGNWFRGAGGILRLLMNQHLILFNDESVTNGDCSVTVVYKSHHRLGL